MMEAIQLHAQNVETTAEVLFELLGYYGQGEATVDAQVTKFVQEHTRNHGIDVARDNEGNTLLIAAVRFQNVQAVDLLLGGDADPTLPNANPATALHYAAASGNGQIVALLLGGGAGGGAGGGGGAGSEQAAFVGMRDITGHTAASYAAQNGHAALIEQLGGLDVGNKKITR
jgi:ankyrin repeat protein